MRPKRRASSICAAAVSGSPDKRGAHRGHQLADIGLDRANLVLDRAQARRVGAGERALHRDLDHLGREAVGVDPGDEHPRGVGLTQPQQQPGALGDPVDRIDVAGRAGLGQQRIAQGDMRPARRQRRVHSAHQARQEGAARTAPRNTSRARYPPGRAGRRPTGRGGHARDIRPAAAAPASWSAVSVCVTTSLSPGPVDSAPALAGWFETGDAAFTPVDGAGAGCAGGGAPCCASAGIANATHRSRQSAAA